MSEKSCVFRTDAERPRFMLPGRVVLHAMRHFEAISKTCRDIDHALLIARRWDESSDASNEAFAACTRIEDVLGVTIRRL